MDGLTGLSAPGRRSIPRGARTRRSSLMRREEEFPIAAEQITHSRRFMAPSSLNAEVPAAAGVGVAANERHAHRRSRMRTEAGELRVKSLDNPAEPAAVRRRRRTPADGIPPWPSPPSAVLDSMASIAGACIPAAAHAQHRGVQMPGLVPDDVLTVRRRTDYRLRIYRGVLPACSIPTTFDRVCLIYENGGLETAAAGDLTLLQAALTASGNLGGRRGATCRPSGWADAGLESCDPMAAVAQHPR